MPRLGLPTLADCFTSYKVSLMRVPPDRGLINHGRHVRRDHVARTPIALDLRELQGGPGRERNEQYCGGDQNCFLKA